MRAGVVVSRLAARHVLNTLANEVGEAFSGSLSELENSTDVDGVNGHSGIELFTLMRAVVDWPDKELCWCVHLCVSCVDEALAA